MYMLRVPAARKTSLFFESGQMVGTCFCVYIYIYIYIYIFIYLDVQRALFSVYRALLSAHKALLGANRALLSAHALQRGSTLPQPYSPLLLFCDGQWGGGTNRQDPDQRETAPQISSW